jgi:transcriptional regulator with XRE-family HTH domain
MDLTSYDDPEDAVGVAFRLTRRRLRVSQRELAALLGWDRATVGRWESGRVAPALGRVDGVLRGMGFRLAVVVSHPEDWTDVDAPAEHLADRALRHLPAHLDQEVLDDLPLHWWLRYRDKPNPMAPNWSYTRRGWRTELRAQLAREREAAAALADAAADSHPGDRAGVDRDDHRGTAVSVDRDGRRGTAASVDRDDRRGTAASVDPADRRGTAASVDPDVKQESAAEV